MKEYIYVFDYSQDRIFRITVDKEDAKYFIEENGYYEIESILRRRGLKESQCAYLFSEKVLEIEDIDPV